MEAAFGWLGEIFAWFGNLIPRWVIVTKTHEGVAFVRGKHVEAVRPGMFFYWPFWTEVMLYPTVRQSVNLPSQTLTTKDECAITVGAVIIYKVSDIEIALAEQWDLSETITDLSMAAVRNVICSSTFDELQENWSDVDENLKKELHNTLKDYGIGILDARLTDFAKTKVVTLIGGGQGGYYEEEEE